MYALLIVIIALTLFAAFLYAGSSSINVDNFIIKSNKGIIETNAMTLATQFNAYENIKGYTLQESNWESELFSLNRYKAKTLDNTNWSYHNGNDGIYFCLNGAISEATYKAFKLAEISAEGIAFVNTSCGSITSINYNGTYPAVFAITYWIRN